jgi:hypothetical protein
MEIHHKTYAYAYVYVASENQALKWTPCRI